MSEIKARTTMYRGIKMRSRLEADFAGFLDWYFVEPVPPGIRPQRERGRPIGIAGRAGRGVDQGAGCRRREDDESGDGERAWPR